MGQVIASTGLAGQSISANAMLKKACSDGGGTLGMYGFTSLPKCYKTDKDGKKIELAIVCKAEEVKSALPPEPITGGSKNRKKSRSNKKKRYPNRRNKSTKNR